MIDFLTNEMREGLERARQRNNRRKNRLRILADGEVHIVLRTWDGGFSVAADTPRLRGLVDLYDGATHVAHCLILASEREDGETRYEYKRRTAATDRPALDFYRDDDAPVGFLPR